MFLKITGKKGLLPIPFIAGIVGIVILVIPAFQAASSLSTAISNIANFFGSPLVLLTSFLILVYWLGKKGGFIK